MGYVNSASCGRFLDILTKNSLKVLRDDWKVNTIRITMYTERMGQLLHKKNGSIRLGKAESQDRR